MKGLLSYPLALGGYKNRLQCVSDEDDWAISQGWLPLGTVDGEETEVESEKCFSWVPGRGSWLSIQHLLRAHVYKMLGIGK